MAAPAFCTAFGEWSDGGGLRMLALSRITLSPCLYQLAASPWACPETSFGPCAIDLPLIHITDSFFLK